jgi:hypothetical protein
VSPESFKIRCVKVTHSGACGLCYGTSLKVGRIKHSGGLFTHGAGNVREERIAHCIIFSLVAEKPCPARCVFYFPIHYYHYYHRYNHLSKLSSSRSARSNLVHRLKDVRSIGDCLGRSGRGAPWRCKQVLVVCKKLHVTVPLWTSTACSSRQSCSDRPLLWGRYSDP